MSLQFGFSTNAFREYELTEAIEIIGAAGYDGVELLFDEPHLYPPTATSEEIETVQQSIRAADLTISNCNAFMLTAIEDFHHPSFIEPEITDRTKRLEYTHASIKTAAALGQSHISIEPGGPVPDGKSRAWGLNRFEQGLRKLLPAAKDAGVKLLVEPEPELLVETSDQFLDLMERIDSPYVRCNFDAGHFYCVDEDPAELVSTLAPYTAHYHLEDIPADRTHEHTQLGDGAMDIEAFLTALEDSGYDGFVTVELYPYESTAAETARESMDYLQDHGWA